MGGWGGVAAWVVRAPAACQLPLGLLVRPLPGEAAGWQPGRTASCGEAVKSNLYGGSAGLRVTDVPRCWRVTEMFYRIKDTDDALIDVTGRGRKGINSPSAQMWENRWSP